MAKISTSRIIIAVAAVVFILSALQEGTLAQDLESVRLNIPGSPGFPKFKRPALPPLPGFRGRPGTNLRRWQNSQNLNILTSR
uniref:Uncharacterized protein n=1 Tax=Rhipicephalus zambeziensis TaxID=60191 RepID=A0A224Y5W9_9ACAR